jgi:UrcA family protein
MTNPDLSTLSTIEETTMTTSTRFRGLIATATFCALASSLVTLGAAADTRDLPQVIVKFGDLNLSNPRAAAKLYGRIDTAAREVCEPLIISGNLASQVRADACVHKAIVDAVTHVNQPALSAVLASKYPTPRPVALAAAEVR